MVRLPRGIWAAFAAVLLSAGCLYPVREKIDGVVCDLSIRPRDLEPATSSPPSASGVAPASCVESAPPDAAPPDATKGDRLQIPPDLLPGGPVARIRLPVDENDPLYPKRKEILDQLFPQLAPLGGDPTPAPGPDGNPLALADLQRLALSNSPLVRQAAANVEAMRGAAVQAGAYPNPTALFQQDTAGTGNPGGPGYIGGGVQQTIKTGDKLQLQRAAAAMDLRNAEAGLRRAETDLATKVRGGYFAVLTARENMRVSRALADFTAEVYQIQVDNVRKAGTAAPYEPMQLRVLAWQARLNVIQARNRYVSAWKQLAAALGLPGMPATELAGRIDVSVPVYEHAAVLAHALREHTDVVAARNDLLKARFNLQSARQVPIPDVSLQVLVQKDYTVAPFTNTVYSVQVGVPVPVWDRNQGGIYQAQASAVQASEEEHRARGDLTGRLADAFERYRNNLDQLRILRDQILPDQVRAYRAVYDRYQKESPGAAPPIVSATPAFSDVVVAQQNLANSVTQYVTTLGALWQAVVDVADVAQTDDLFQVNGAAVPTECVGPLPQLPCYHPCSPLQDPALKGDQGPWPAGAPAAPPQPPTQPMPPAKDERQRRRIAPIDADPLLTPPPELKGRP
jgi:cobalt-zinc-cadmium efflux system outer membrane protein